MQSQDSDYLRFKSDPLNEEWKGRMRRRARYLEKPQKYILEKQAENRVRGFFALRGALKRIKKCRSRLALCVLLEADRTVRDGMVVFLLRLGTL